MPTDFETQLAFGKQGEHIVARWLLGRGSAVAPLYQYEQHDKAPVILWTEAGRSISCVLPDLHCYRAGKAFFAEVKRKNQWWCGGADGRSPGLRETGTNARLWDEYLRVRGRTGCPVWVFFLHESMEPTGLFAGEVSELEERGPRRWGRGRRELMFVQREWLTFCSELSGITEAA